MKNLDLFKLSKNQMNQISGGYFSCDISDVGFVEYKDWIGSSGTIEYHNMPDETTIEQVEQLIRSQIGSDFYINCIEKF